MWENHEKIELRKRSENRFIAYINDLIYSTRCQKYVLCRESYIRFEIAQTIIILYIILTKFCRSSNFNHFPTFFHFHLFNSLLLDVSA
jgi:hypothetical protein